MIQEISNSLSKTKIKNKNSDDDDDDDVSMCGATHIDNIGTVTMTVWLWELVLCLHKNSLDQIDCWQQQWCKGGGGAGTV